MTPEEIPLKSDATVSALLEENRIFHPPYDFKAKAFIKDASIYERARQDPQGFWAEWAGKLEWFKKWDKVLEWDVPYSKWFIGGKLNASYNCLDRHIKAGLGGRKPLFGKGNRRVNKRF